MPSGDDQTTRALQRSVEDPEAFRIVFDAHHSAIRGYLRHRLGDIGLAEDLAAETFARAFAARGRFRDTGAGVRPWLYAIATNLLRDEARRGAGGRQLLGRLRPPAPVLLELPEDPDPALRRALRTLRPQELDVLLLHAWGELSYAEIAAVTGTRVGTVRSRLSRARERMRRALPDHAHRRTPVTPRNERTSS